MILPNENMTVVAVRLFDTIFLITPTKYETETETQSHVIELLALATAKQLTFFTSLMIV